MDSRIESYYRINVLGSPTLKGSCDQKNSLTHSSKITQQSQDFTLDPQPMNSGHFPLYQVLPQIFFVFLHFLKQKGGFTIAIYKVQHFEN